MCLKTVLFARSSVLKENGKKKGLLGPCSVWSDSSLDKTIKALLSIPNFYVFVPSGLSGISDFICSRLR